MEYSANKTYRNTCSHGAMERETKYQTNKLNVYKVRGDEGAEVRRQGMNVGRRQTFRLRWCLLSKKLKKMCKQCDTGWGVRGEVILDRVISKCKGPEVRVCLTYSRNIKEASG